MCFPRLVAGLLSKTVEITRAHLRQLHKIGAVFQVDWLSRDCRKFLRSIIADLGPDSDEDLEFALEESRYIANRWGHRILLLLFIRKIQKLGKSPEFVQRYTLREFASLSVEQIKLMLEICSNDCGMILKLILERVRSTRQLESTARTFLSNMNLTLCLRQRSDLYHDLLETLMELDLNKEDTAFLLKLHTKASRSLGPISSLRDPTSNTIVGRFRLQPTSFDLFYTGENVTAAINLAIKRVIGENQPQTALYRTLNVLLTPAVFKQLSASTDSKSDAMEANKTLEFAVTYDKWTKVSTRYIDSILTCELWSMPASLKKFLVLMKTRDCLTNNSTNSSQLSAIPFTELRYKTLSEIKGTFSMSFQHGGLGPCTESDTCRLILDFSQKVSQNKTYLDVNLGPISCTAPGQWCRVLARGQDIFLHLRMERRVRGKMLSYPLPLSNYGHGAWIVQPHMEDIVAEAFVSWDRTWTNSQRDLCMLLTSD